MALMPAAECDDKKVSVAALDLRGGLPSDALDAAFGAALATITAALRAYARGLTGSAVDADDLVQETMLRCWRARASFLPGTNLVAWARAVMRNGFISGRRRARFHVELSSDAFERLAGVPGGQEQTVELRDVRWALSKLSHDHREAVLLASEGLSIEEAASRLDIPEGTVKSRVARGRRRLRELTENRDASAPLVEVSPPAPDRNAGAPPRHRRIWAGVMIG